MDDPNDLFFQLREFSLFMDFDVADGVMASVEIEAGDNATVLTPNYAYMDLDVGTVFDFWDSEKLGNLSVRIGKVLVPFLS